jgi:hypothetical protein
MKNEIDLETLCAYWESQGVKMSIKTYYRLAKEGKLARIVKGKVDAMAALCSIAAYFQRDEDETDLTEERRLKTIEERKIKEMERRRMEGELMPVEAVENELVQRTYVIKSDMLALEKRLVRWPDAREIVKKGHLHMMNKYSGKTGVFRNGK